MEKTIKTSKELSEFVKAMKAVDVPDNPYGVSYEVFADFEDGSYNTYKVVATEGGYELKPVRIMREIDVEDFMNTTGLTASVYPEFADCLRNRLKAFEEYIK